MLCTRELLARALVISSATVVRRCREQGTGNRERHSSFTLHHHFEQHLDHALPISRPKTPLSDDANTCHDPNIIIL